MLKNDPFFIYMNPVLGYTSDSIFKLTSVEEVLSLTKKELKKMSLKISHRNLGESFIPRQKSKYKDAISFINLDLNDNNLRTDEVLITLVDDGLLKKYLKIIEIPDEVDWYVDNIDKIDWRKAENSINWDELNDAISKTEIIREKHRIWQ